MKRNELEALLRGLTHYFGPRAIYRDKERAKAILRDLFDHHYGNALVSAMDTVLGELMETDVLAQEDLQQTVADLTASEGYHRITKTHELTLMTVGVVASGLHLTPGPSPMMSPQQVQALTEHLKAAPCFEGDVEVVLYPQWMIYSGPLLSERASSMKFIDTLAAQDPTQPERFTIPRAQDVEASLRERENSLPYAVFCRHALFVVKTPVDSMVKVPCDPAAMMRWKQELKRIVGENFVPGLDLQVTEPLGVVGGLDHLENVVGFTRVEVMIRHALTMRYALDGSQLGLIVSFFTTNAQSDETYTPELRFSLVLNHEPQRPFLGDIILMTGAFSPVIFDQQIQALKAAYGLEVKILDEPMAYLGREEEWMFANWDGHPVTLSAPETLQPKVSKQHLN